jgi:CheY-like chemotaxis protein
MNRILCVDDEPILHEIMDLLIDEKLAESQLYVARGAAEARSILREPVNLCLVDVMMPGVDGIELTREIRAQQPHCPIVVFSAKEDDDLEAKAIAAGANRFVRKPFEVDELMDTMNQLLFPQA